MIVPTRLFEGVGSGASSRAVVVGIGQTCQESSCDIPIVYSGETRCISVAVDVSTRFERKVEVAREADVALQSRAKAKGVGARSVGIATVVLV